MLPQEGRAVPRRSQEEVGPDLRDAVDAMQDASNFPQSCGGSRGHGAKAGACKVQKEGPVGALLYLLVRFLPLVHVDAPPTTSTTSSSVLGYLAHVPGANGRTDFSTSACSSDLCALTVLISWKCSAHTCPRRRGMRDLEPRRRCGLSLLKS